ncbi:DUF3037 domain-containing protein [Flavobacterium circumlabens]|uniref:DUF3037 domain-containing protein n=1 Tax=Flavobacterium circumlabens TaxID=2133765 RepID=A0A4Y7UJJ2_9FLAO|nr:DUF3037 domain-containing protein [Flavobacterium circumlabens]TCN60852.1 DUF3037 family protein [Flavobacterium circumlabens]TEB45982.1 DUF3037 domain-containing protein [Flavobacterium circumlabens]
MTTKHYTYSILKYKHSPLLDESINIGVLIFFEETKRFHFNYSKNLSRIKYIYPNVPEKTIREYLKQIDRKLTQFNLDFGFFTDNELENLSDFISKYVLPIDGTILQFSAFRRGLQNNFSESVIENTIVKKHIIEDIRLNNNQPQEPKLVSTLFQNLKEFGLNDISYKPDIFQQDYTLINKLGTEFKFDLAWQNGTYNLVKSIGFDLKGSKSIADKAYKYFGQFYDLENEAQEKKLRYDLLVGKPTQKALFKEYDHALELLKKNNHVEVIEEQDLKKYSVKVINAISEHLEN